VISLKVSDNHVQMQKDRSIRRQGALNCTWGCEVNAADLHSFRWHNELTTGPIANLNYRKILVGRRWADNECGPVKEHLYQAEPAGLSAIKRSPRT